MTPEQTQLLKNVDGRLRMLEELFSNHKHKDFDRSKILDALALNRHSAYASGTAYQLTATAALVDFGTTDPAITITVPGVYLLFAKAHLKYNGATFAANRTVTLKIRKTSGTAADVSNASRTFVTDIITTKTYSAGIISLPVVVYTAGPNTTLQLWGSIDVVPSAGSLDVIEAEIIAVHIV